MRLLTAPNDRNVLCSSFQFSNLTARRLNKSLPAFFAPLTRNCKRVQRPENFEQFNQSYGYALYSHQLSGRVPAQLQVELVRDLAYVFIDDEFQVRRWSSFRLLPGRD